MIVAGSGPARGRDDRVLRGAHVRRRVGDAGLAGAPAVPGRDRHPAGLHGLPREVARGLGAGAASGSSGCSRWGSTRPTRTSPASRSRCACCASSSRRCGSSDRHPDLGRRRPVRLVAKCCSDLGKPAASWRWAARRRASASRPRRRGACRASARRPPSAWPSWATRRSRQLQEADEAQLAARFGDRWARYLKARATFHDDSPVETETGAAKSRLDGAHVRHGHRVAARSSRRCCAGCRASSARDWQRKAPAGADGGDQGPA